MFRFLVAHLPCFRLERCGWSPRQRVALVAPVHGALRVQAVTPALARLGVHPGMSQAQARARVPDLQTEALIPDEESADLEELTAQLLPISPQISALLPSALVAQLPRHRDAPPGAERALIERVRGRLGHLGHLARVVIADDPDTALRCATWGRSDRLIPVGQGAAALAPLPLDALDLPPAERALLRGLGVQTIGAFARLSPSSVAGRLGPLGVAAHALAQGRVSASPLPSWSGDDGLALRQDLPDPVDQLDALLFVLNALLRDGATRMIARGHAASRLGLRFGLDDGAEQTVSIRLGEPTRDPRRVLSLLRLRLERFQLAAPVVSVELSLDTHPFHGRQHRLLQRRRAGVSMADTVARLQDTLGAAAVATPLAVDRHRPEAAWRPAPATLQPPPRPVQVDDPVATWLHDAAPPPPQRPPLLLPTPLAVEVRATPLGAPTAVNLDGRWLPVTSLRGPEALAGEWWARGFDREYWRVALADGRHAWIYQEDERWFLHGWWDR